MDAKSPRLKISKAPVRGAMVWDLPLRIFHWALVCVVTIGFVTGYFAPEWWLDVHVMAGYSVGFLLFFRILWGFFGSYYSLFRNFPLDFSEIAKYIKAILQKNTQPTAGHNPLGAWMIALLLTLLITITLTGLIASGGQENLGPLQKVISYNIGHISSEIHEVIAGLLAGAIGIHLAGVFVDSKILRHSIIRPMITGKKQVSTPTLYLTGLSNISLYALFGILFSSIVSAGLWLNWQPTRNNVDSGVFLASYESECGDCHNSYHPSLRLKSSWVSIMTGLTDHYGEDASLDDETRMGIENFLVANDASLYDTEISWKIGRATALTDRITDTKYWKYRHKDIDDAVFLSGKIGSKVNCNNCHSDGATGRFDDENIHIPEGSIK